MYTHSVEVNGGEQYGSEDIPLDHDKEQVLGDV
jgi:hypothetical protein